MKSETLNCGDNELSSPQNFQSNVDQFLYFNWSPPESYETCEVEYELHINNLNTSEYLTPVINTFDREYVYDYEKDGHICIHVRSKVYAIFDGESDPVYTTNFLDPTIELGPPSSLTIENSSSSLKLNWTTPEGYEKCRAYFMFFIKIILINAEETVLMTNVAGYAYSYIYQENDLNDCQEAAVEVVGYYRGMPGHAISKTIIFGPDCKQKLPY
nr:uncharacterized protein LOC111414024 [Onthophagus taurus]